VDLGAKLKQVDRAQQRRPWLAFPVAVAARYGDDRVASHAALIAYYGFFALFPLLLALTSILGFVLAGNEALQQRIVHLALESFPVVGDDIGGSVGSLRGSGPLLLLASVIALWTSLGVVRTTEAAMDDIWGVPRRERRGFVGSVLHSGLMIVVLGGGLLAGIVLGGFASLTRDMPLVGTLGSLTGQFAINLALMLAAYRLLTTAETTWRTVVPGGLVAAVGWTLLSLVGTWLVGRRLAHAAEVYGLFATVIVLLSWIALGAQLLLIGVEVNVVKTKHLWPRSLTSVEVRD
jgi:YihY family inner membrane protein